MGQNIYSLRDLIVNKLVNPSREGLKNPKSLSWSKMGRARIAVVHCVLISCNSCKLQVKENSNNDTMYITRYVMSCQWWLPFSILKIYSSTITFIYQWFCCLGCPRCFFAKKWLSSEESSGPTVHRICRARINGCAKFF